VNSPKSRLTSFGLLLTLSMWCQPGCAAPRTGQVDAAIYHYTPEGYVEMANALIMEGRVKYSCATGRITADLKEGSPEWEWYQDSYLKEDVERFNEEKGGQLRWTPRADRFIIEGCSLTEVNRYAHTISLPRTSGEIREWEGDFAYARGDAVGTLRGDQQSIAITTPQQAFRARDIEPVPVWGPKNLAMGDRSLLSPTVAGFFFPPSGKAAALVYAVGNTTVIKDQRGAGNFGDHEILINGHSLPHGRVARLAEGDWVQFAQRDAGATRRETYLHAGKDLTSVISAAGLRNSSIVRVTEPNSLGFTEDLIDGMNVIYRELGEEGVTFDPRQGSPSHLELTLRSDAQRTVTTTLTRFIESSRDLQHDRPRRASVTVMDTFTGDVLALASYPNRPEQISRFPYLSDGERRRLLANQNFARHPIGSAGKPFWMAAILNVFPFLASFTVEPHNGTDSYETVIGYPLSSGYEEHTHLGDRIGIDRALAVSCNKFMIDLATTALGLDPAVTGRERLAGLQDALKFSANQMPSGDRFSICGMPASKVPLLERHLRGADTLAFMDQNKVFSQMENITGVRLHDALAPEQALAPSPAKGDRGFGSMYRTASFHALPWIDVIAPFDERSRTQEGHRVIRAQFAAVSPEAVNLAINTVNTLRGRWVNMLLGGDSSVWNNIQLGEAVSRIVTGRDVRARFVGSFGSATAERGTRPPFIQGFDERARRPVLVGMRKVVTAADGTAARMRGLPSRLAARFPGYHAYVFAKTGTPAVDLLTPPAFVQFVGRLNKEKGLSYEPSQHVVQLTSAGQSLLSRFPRFRGEVEGLLVNINANPDDYRIESEEEAKNGPLYFRGETLRYNDAARSAATSKGGVFLLSAVLTPSAPSGNGPVVSCLPPVLQEEVRQVPLGASFGPHAVGLTIAVYIEDIPTTSVMAVDFTSKLEDEIIRLLTLQIAQRKATVRQ
jgi:hypothetical protein